MIELSEIRRKNHRFFGIGYIRWMQLRFGQRFFGRYIKMQHVMTAQKYINNPKKKKQYDSDFNLCIVSSKDITVPF